MKPSSGDDLFLGGILVDPISTFSTPYEPIFKGFKQDLYSLCREMFIMDGAVSLGGVMTKMKDKHPWFTSKTIVDLMDGYYEHSEQLRLDRRDYGEPYCSWPKQGPDPKMIDLVELISKLLEDAAFHREESKAAEKAFAARMAAEVSPPPVTYDDLPF